MHDRKHRNCFSGCHIRYLNHAIGTSWFIPKSTSWFLQMSVKEHTAGASVALSDLQSRSTQCGRANKPTIRFSLSDIVLWPNRTKDQISSVPTKIDIWTVEPSYCVVCDFSFFHFVPFVPHDELGTMPCMYSSSTSCFKSHTLGVVWYEGDLRWELWSSLLHASTLTSHLPVLLRVIFQSQTEDIMLQLFVHMSEHYSITSTHYLTL